MASKLAEDTIEKISIGMLITIGTGLVVGTGYFVRLSMAVEEVKAKQDSIENIKTDIAVIREKIENIEVRISQDRAKN